MNVPGLGNWSWRSWGGQVGAGTVGASVCLISSPGSFLEYNFLHAKDVEMFRCIAGSTSSSQNLNLNIRAYASRSLSSFHYWIPSKSREAVSFS
jgi:hypothetical protein